jgi:hypothetical protein
MLFKRINLEFFKGGSTTTQVQKRDPKSAELVNMDSAVYNILSPIAARYGGISMPSSYVTKNSKGEYVTSTDVPVPSVRTTDPVSSKLGTSSSSSRTGGSAAGWSGGYNKHGDYVGSNGAYDSSGRYVGSKAQYIASQQNSSPSSSAAAATPVSSALDLGNWNDSVLGQNFNIADEQAALTNANILNLLQTTPEYLNKHSAFLENGTDEGFENYLAASEQAIANAYSKNVGTDLNNMAAKGILNSSVTNRALANQQAETGNAIAANRNEAANTWLNNYISGYNAGVSGLDSMIKLPTQYYQNALAPVMPLYNYWKDMTDAYYGHEDYDTVVSSGGK